MTMVHITHIGGPTALIEFDGWRILTDPTFDAPGKRYFFGWGTTSTKVTGPAIDARDLGEIDAVLLSHHHHGDNLDRSGRTLLNRWGTVFTTRKASKAVGGRAVGLTPWDTAVLDSAGKPSITITATPCRHGPVGTNPITGPVIGFALGWAGQENGLLWMTGDTVLHRGLHVVADRLDIGTVLMHLGGVKFPYLTGGIRYTLNASEAVRLLELVKPNTVIPVHYEGWTHFHEGRAAADGAFHDSAFADAVRWAEPGVATAIHV